MLKQLRLKGLAARIDDDIWLMQVKVKGEMDTADELFSSKRVGHGGAWRRTALSVRRWSLTWIVIFHLLKVAVVSSYEV